MKLAAVWAGESPLADRFPARFAVYLIRHRLFPLGREFACAFRFQPFEPLIGFVKFVRDRVELCPDFFPD